MNTTKRSVKPKKEEAAAKAKKKLKNMQSKKSNLRLAKLEKVIPKFNSDRCTKTFPNSKLKGVNTFDY